MEDNASSQTPEHETTINNFVERINLDGNSIISTPDKLQIDNMASVDNLRLATSSLSVLSEKDEIDFLGSSAKTLHKTISDYVDQNFGSHHHFLAQCSYQRSPLLKYRNNRPKSNKRQKPTKDPSGKTKPTSAPPKECPINICRPGYKATIDRRKSRQFTKDDLTSTTTEKPAVDSFKASDRKNVDFKPSVLTRVDSGPIKVRRIHRTGAKPTPFKGNIKETKGSKLRYEFNRKQGSIPSHLQDHINKFKKPPFRKAIPHPQNCFDDIIERLHKLKKLVPNASKSPAKGASPSIKKAAGKTAKSRKPKKSKKEKSTD